jgi:hypothetical protein
MNLVWAAGGGLVLALQGAPGVVAPAREGTIEASDAATAESLPATEVVRIKRDFGKPHFDLVIDAWADPEAARLEGGVLPSYYTRGALLL